MKLIFWSLAGIFFFNELKQRRKKIVSIVNVHIPLLEKHEGLD